MPSTLLSRAGRARKRALVDSGKHGARDALQVLANGGVAAVCAVLFAVQHDPKFAAAFAGAFAAASADTWGTEIGTLAKGRPRSILTFRPLQTGLSGGVTPIGTLAEVAGAFSVAAVASAAASLPLFCIAAGGVAGALADSIAGASVQELRYCDRCARACETDPHACGSASRRIRGYGWMTNDAVNALATLTGAAAAALLSTFFPSMG